MEQLLRGDALRETLIWCYGDGTVREQFSRENHWETRGNHWNSQGSRKGEKKLSGLPFVCDVPFAQPLFANKDIYIYIVNFGAMMSFGAQSHAFLTLRFKL